MCGGHTPCGSNHTCTHLLVVCLISPRSHGTQDFYEQSAELTKALIRERGFNAVVVEADLCAAMRRLSPCLLLHSDEP